VKTISPLLRKLLLLFRRRRFRSELDEEMAFHREEAERELVESGLSSQVAHTAAMRRFGNPARLREDSHRAIAFRSETILQDLRFALRQLRKNPGFALTAIFTLALGITSSVSIFAFVDAALIKPLPYKDPTKLVQLYESIPLGPRFHLSYPDYLDWKRMNKSFSSLDIFAPYGFMQKTPDGLRAADGARVSAGFFRTLGVMPILGRDFYDGEDGAAPARTVLLSYSAWQKRYATSNSVLGQSVTLNGDDYTIIGVLPRGFHFAPAEPADFWAIEKPNGQCEQNRSCHNMFGVARLRPGVTFAAAYEDIKSIGLQLQRQYPDQNRDRYANMLFLTEVIVGDIRPILLTTLCGAGLLLLIASINVASLLLVRAEGRKRETAVRGALGASPRRLVRQFVTEGLLLATLGCAIGISVAREAMHLLVTLIPKGMMASMPYLAGLGLSTHVIVFACLLSLFAATLFSLTPLARLRLGQMREGLVEGARGSAGVAWRRFGGNLVVAELATATVLLAGAGLLTKSFYRLLHVDIGLEPDHIAMVRVNAPPEKYPHDPQQAALGRRIIDTISALPGVTAAGLTTKLPIEDADGTSTFLYVGRANYGEDKEVSIRSVTPGYMSTLRTTLIAGRYFSETDNALNQKVVIINQEMARKYFPGESPIGRQISFDGDKAPPMLIVGVIRDIQEGQLDAAPRGAMYLPFDQSPDYDFALLIRTRQDEQIMLPALQSALRSIDPGMAISDPTTMQTKIHDAPSTYLHRSSAWLVGGFAATALLLGVVGLYGVIAYSVSQRTREIGVRMALGAQRGAVYRMVMRQAGWLTAAGVGLGLICSVGAALLMRKLLFGVAAWDALTLAIVALVLAIASLAASFLPARRAARVDPIEALRTE
jgi:macrolide transport system ATP-binding/permease protein